MDERQASKNRMNKKWKVRALCILCVMTFASLSLVSSTYAKFATTAGGVDVARVAKWGVTATIVGDDLGLFAEKYKDGVPAVSTAINLSAESSAEGENIVAPGLSNSMTVTVAGQPETATHIYFDTSSTTDLSTDEKRIEAGWKYFNDANGNGTEDVGEVEAYEPIRWSITENGVSKLTDGSLSDLLNVLDELGGDYAPNTSLDKTYVISWSWAFHIDDATDAKDTYLGRESAAGRAATLQFAFILTIEQIN